MVVIAAQVQKTTLVVPHRFFTHGQNRMGDRHIYAARTRFIPNEILKLFQCTAWPLAGSALAATRVISQGPKIDIGSRMRGMWGKQTADV